MDQDRLKYLKGKYPTVPEYALPVARGSKKKSPANELTSAISQYIESKGGYAFRVNTQGNYSEKQGRFILSGATKGVSDLVACYDGLLIGIEIKIGRDQQSDVQKRFQERVEGSGGKYIIARTLDQFKADFQTYCNNEK